MDRNHGLESPPQPQQQLAESLSASTSDGGGSLIAQLTGNPYFTAVSPIQHAYARARC